MKARLFTLLVVVTASAFAAAPTIRWQLNNPAINPHDKRLVAANTWYEMRVDAWDADGNLTDIRIYKDGQPFAFAGGNDGYHNNWGGYSYDSSGLHLFEAYAVDGTGQQSSHLYWVTKIYSGTPVPITFADLQSLAPFYVSASEARFPNTGNPHINAANLADVLGSLAYTNGKTLSFPAEPYEFDVSFDRRHNLAASDELGKIDGNGYYNPGQPFRLQNATNFSLKGSTSGESLLRWASYDSNGSIFSSAPIEGFFAVDNSCTNIYVDHLTFDTHYTQRKNEGGRHLDIHNTGCFVSYCKFYHAPSFAISVKPGFQAQGLAPEPAYVHLDANFISDTFSDGIHVQAGHDIWIVGNALIGTGDDAIAFVNHESGDAASTRFTRNFHAIWNYIADSRGVGIGGGTFTGTSTDHSQISYNTIDGTGSSAISLFKAASSVYTADMEYIEVLANTINRAGAINGVNSGSPKAAIEIYEAKNIIGYMSNQTTGWNKITNATYRRIKGSSNHGNVKVGISNDSSNNAPDDIVTGAVEVYQQ